MAEREGIDAHHASMSGMATARRIAVNVTSLLTSDMLTRAANFIVYALVARHCGSTAFGQLSLGMILLYSFQVFACAGLPTLITREAAKRPDLSGKYLINGSLIVCGTVLLTLVALFLLVVVSHYPKDTREIILLMGLSILPWSLTTISEALFKAWERMHLIVQVAIPVQAAKVGVTYFLLKNDYEVRSIAFVFLGSYAVALVLEWLLLYRHIPARGASPDLRFSRTMLSRAWRFLGIDSIIAVWGSTNALLLSWFVGEAAVGVYAAAWQLLVPMTLIVQAVSNSMFPIMCRRAEGNRKRMQQLTIWMLEMQAIVTVPFCVLLYFCSSELISLVYSHKDFSNSVVALRIMLPALLLQVICSTLGQVLYSRRQEHVTLWIVVVDCLFNLICGAAMIYSFGLVGAAIVVLLTWILNAYLHYAATCEALTDEAGQRVRWGATLIWHVVVAGCVMAGVLAVLSELHFVVASILTSLVYLAILAVLLYVACRGSAGFRERFLTPLKDH